MKPDDRQQLLEIVGRAPHGARGLKLGAVLP